MLSPAGVVQKSDGFDITKLKSKKGKMPPKIILSIAKTVWTKKWSPFGIMRGLGGCISKSLIKNYLTRRMPSLSKEEF